MTARGSDREILGEPHSPLDGMLDWAEAGARRTEPATAAGIEEVAQRTWALIVEILDGYLIPHGEAQQLLDDIFRYLAHRWSRLARPDIWLVLRINHACVDWWRERSREQFREQGRADSAASVQWMEMCDRVEAVIGWRLSRRLRRIPDVSPENPRDPRVAEIEPARWSDGS
jgi:DNA-directed RNA polymerase specialized sigma24 family protein